MVKIKVLAAKQEPQNRAQSAKDAVSSCSTDNLAREWFNKCNLCVANVTEKVSKSTNKIDAKRVKARKQSNKRRRLKSMWTKACMTAKSSLFEAKVTKK